MRTVILVGLIEVANALYLLSNTEFITQNSNSVGFWAFVLFLAIIFDIIDFVTNLTRD